MIYYVHVSQKGERNNNHIIPSSVCTVDIILTANNNKWNSFVVGTSLAEEKKEQKEKIGLTCHLYPCASVATDARR